MKLNPQDLGQPLVFYIWNSRKASSLLKDGKVSVKDLVEEDVATTAKAGEDGLSMSQRQWLQVDFAKRKHKKPYIDKKALSAAFASWTFPLYFIEFETSTVAIPCNSGQRP